MRNGECRSSYASPLSAALLRGTPRAGWEVAGAGFPAAAAPSGAAPPLRRPPAPSLPERILARWWDPLAAAAGSARDWAGARPALPPAGGRALGYHCAVSGTLCDHRVIHTSRKTFTVFPLSLQSVRNPQGSIGAIWFIDY